MPSACAWREETSSQHSQRGRHAPLAVPDAFLWATVVGKFITHPSLPDLRRCVRAWRGGFLSRSTCCEPWSVCGDERFWAQPYARSTRSKRSSRQQGRIRFGDAPSRGVWMGSCVLKVKVLPKQKMCVLCGRGWVGWWGPAARLGRDPGPGCLEVSPTRPGARAQG